METIDINKVAGLQALDSEGNVLGVVSMEQLTDMVAGKLATELAAQNTAPAMRTMSLTASPAAASVAATGVDKTEGQLGDVTDPGYVRVLDKNGNSGKQGISQFASVVGGLLPIAPLTNLSYTTNKNCKITMSAASAVIGIMYCSSSNGATFTPTACIIYRTNYGYFISNLINSNSTNYKFEVSEDGDCVYAKTDSAWTMVSLIACKKGDNSVTLETV